jgi:hypothetical protein
MSIVDDINEFDMQIESHLKEIDRLKKAKQILIDKWQETCPHPSQTSKSTYYEGSYLDRSRSIETIYCAICGKKLGEQTHIGWYA